ncbi:MAG: DUF2868 domain-containing protein [Pseudomonadales bacterium]
MQLATAVAVIGWLRDDAGEAYAARLQRDRAIGATLPAASPGDRVTGWWAAVAGADTARQGERRLAHGLMLARLVLVALGLLTGIAAMAGVLAYAGDRPANLLLVFAILLLIPTLLLLGGLALSHRASSNAFRLSPFVPGGVVFRWLDRLGGRELFVDTWPGSMTLRVWRLQLLVLSQWMACGFFGGALLDLVFMVTFTDLAFGWSTTLDLSATTFANICAVIAAPWAHWLPMAVPDAALVEASRYFRLEDGARSRAMAATLGNWWPFVLMAVTVWGLMPRLLLLAFWRWRLNRATDRMLVEHAEVQALLERLRQPVIAVNASAPDAARQALGPVPPANTGRQEGPAVTMIWNDAWALTAAGARGDNPLDGNARQVGSSDSQAQWEEDIQTLSGRLRIVWVLVAGWEPPLLVFRDFLELLRRQVHRDCALIVVPLNLEGTGVDAAARPVWQGALGAWDVPGLHVAEAWAPA